MSAAGLSATGPVLPRVPRAARPGGARPGASATRGWRGVALAISLLLPVLQIIVGLALAVALLMAGGFGVP